MNVAEWFWNRVAATGSSAKVVIIDSKEITMDSNEQSFAQTLNDVAAITAVAQMAHAITPGTAHTVGTVLDVAAAHPQVVQGHINGSQIMSLLLDLLGRGIIRF